MIRGQLAAIVTVFPWGLVLEEFIGGLFDSTQPYLPFTTTGRWRERHSVADPARFPSPPRPAWWRPSRCSSRASQRARLYRRTSRSTQFGDGRTGADRAATVGFGWPPVAPRTR
jgi:hypothetical protein